MKTFDIALKHLTAVNLAGMNIFDFNDPANKPIQKSIEPVVVAFMADPENTASNEHYRSVCFEVALYHLLDQANGRASCWNVALEIIESNPGGADYDSAGLDKFMDYCDKLEKPPFYLAPSSEMKVEIFMAAYHYVKGEK